MGDHERYGPADRCTDVYATPAQRGVDSRYRDGTAVSWNGCRSVHGGKNSLTIVNRHRSNSYHRGREREESPLVAYDGKNGTRDERANALCFCARPTSTAKTHKIRIESSRVHFSYQPTLTGAGRTLLSIVHRP